MLLSTITNGQWYLIPSAERLLDIQILHKNATKCVNSYNVSHNLSSTMIELKVIVLCAFSDIFPTKYSLLNSYSSKASCLSSHESSKAVRMGSLLDSAMREGEARAR